MELEHLINRCREIIECDTARIERLTKMFLIIGFNRNTKDDAYWWIKDGKPHDFDYVEEKVVASGNNAKELLGSAREYKRWCGVNWEEYFQELRETGHAT